MIILSEMKAEWKANNTKWELSDHENTILAPKYTQKQQQQAALLMNLNLYFTHHAEAEKISAVVVQSKAVNSFEVDLEMRVRVRIAVGELY